MLLVNVGIIFISLSNYIKHIYLMSGFNASQWVFVISFDKLYDWCSFCCLMGVIMICRKTELVLTKSFTWLAALFDLSSYM